MHPLYSLLDISCISGSQMLYSTQHFRFQFQFSVSCQARQICKYNISLTLMIESSVLIFQGFLHFMVNDSSSESMPFSSLFQKCSVSKISQALWLTGPGNHWPSLLQTVGSNKRRQLKSLRVCALKVGMEVPLRRTLHRRPLIWPSVSTSCCCRDSTV